MAPASRKIINDPVYGFITIDHPLLLKVISHPYYQRLRRIQQMAFAQLVYPGAVHTRLHHSLGAYHLMCNALTELKNKGIAISPEEELSAKIAILLHDVGHGPYSHALENVLVQDLSHEMLSILIMRELDATFDGQLEMALAMFTNDYPKKFLHQLISGQLDVDRMDYLTRDSFYTGVAEGVIGYDRILKMLTIFDGQLVVEEKAIYSIEKFLVSRRLMYWQVYLHKTVLSAERMLVQIVERAKRLISEGEVLPSCSPMLEFFLRKEYTEPIEMHLHQFCQLDDVDVMGALKSWSRSRDPVLSILCRSLTERRLLKVKFQTDRPDPDWIRSRRWELASKFGIDETDAAHFVFSGEAVNTTYDTSDERINILFKNGELKDISRVDNALIHQALSSPVKKFYICYDLDQP